MWLIICLSTEDGKITVTTCITDGHPFRWIKEQERPGLSLLGWIKLSDEDIAVARETGTIGF